MGASNESATGATATTKPPFVAGQLVRLTASFTGRCMTYRDSAGILNPKPPTWFPTGTVFTVMANAKLARRCELKAGAETVLVKDERGTWCIPARLLELVPASEQPQPIQPPQPPTQQSTEPKESGRDTQGDRVN